MTKSNFGHSTLSVNNQLHIVNGLATLTKFNEHENPEATFDMSATLGDVVSTASRKFVKDSPTSIHIEDEIEKSEKTKFIIWQLMTVANVEIVEGGAILKQDGKELKVENLTHPEINFSVISLFPAPLELDKQIEGLKRLELRIPAWTIEGNKTRIKVRLSGN